MAPVFKGTPASPARAKSRLAPILTPRTVWAVTLSISILSAGYVQRTEGGPAALFVTAVMLTLGSLIAVISRSLLFAMTLITAIVAIIRTASYVKQQKTEVLLHALDVVSLLSSRSALSVFWLDYRGDALWLLAALLVTAIAACLAYRIDGTRISRRRIAVATLLFATLACAAAVAKGERRHTEFYFENVYVSFFIASWADAFEAFWRGQLLQAAPIQEASNLTIPTTCEPASRPPNIILIHQESVVPPAYFPALSYDRSLDRFFQSFDGQTRKLRVETYGGGSWLTEFSVFTGLSTFSFGGMRQVIQQVMAGKIQDTLPQALARCGFRSVVFYPMLRHFLGTKKFFEGVGLSKIFDAKDQRAMSANERDSFYYANLISEMERHFKSSRQPLFAYLETMAAHGVYTDTFMPEVDVPGGGSGTHPEMHEYLRRLAMARSDYASFHAELARRFPGQQFLIVHYGDHQPTATSTLLGFDKDTTIETVMRSGNADALMTYYVIDAIRYRPPPLPALNALDVPYLGTMILDAARIPLSDAFRARKRLMLLCDGRYARCPAEDEVLHFHRRLLNSGLVNAR
jgi:phosphoglycerol transferase MdoB-like AlkP superfamily enzyme